MYNQGSIVGAAHSGNGLLSQIKAAQSSAVASPTTNALGYSGSAGQQLSGTPTALLLLVTIEALALIALRRGFRFSHGG